MRGDNGAFLPLYLYPRSVVDNPPSVRSGHLSPQSELKNRALGCLLIAKAGRMLTLPQSSISAAHVLLHRFYFRVSMHSFKLLRVCMTALFLAAKVEETPVRLRCVLACFDRLLKRRAGLDPTPLSEHRFGIWAQGVASCEEAMLRELGFELYIELPHAFILHFLSYVHPRIDESGTATEQRTWQLLRQHSWNALNDALFSPKLLFVHRPHVLACAAILLASSLMALALPAEWWRLFDVQTAEVDAAAHEMALLYALLSEGELEYTPAHPEDNDTNNEMCRYRARNRQELLAEKKRQQQQQQQQQQQLQEADKQTVAQPAATSTGTGATLVPSAAPAPEERNTDVADSSSNGGTSAPMEA